MHGKACFYGSATVGTKGQIVIPLEARDALGIVPGDKLVIIGMNDGQKRMLGVCPVKSIEALLGALTDHMNSIQEVVEKAKKED